jgi:hypothetical protein
VLKIRHYAKPPNVMGKFKNKDGLHKLKGLTTQSDKKQYISGDQNPLKKNGAYSEKPYE